MTGCRGGVRAALLGVAGSGRRCSARDATVVYLLGAMVPILLAQPESAAERAHRVRIGLGPGVPARRARSLQRAHRRERCSKATDRPKPTSSIATPTAIRRAPASMGWRAAGLRRARRRRTRRRAAARRARRARAARRRAVRLRQRLFRHARQDRRSLAQPVVPHRRPRRARRRRRASASSTASRTRSAGAARTSRRTRSSRCCSSHPAVAAVAVYPVRSELAEDEVMAALVARAGQRARPSRAGRVLRAAAAVLRDPALHRHRRRPAAHRERQGAEVPAARARRHADAPGTASRKRLPARRVD